MTWFELDAEKLEAREVTLAARIGDPCPVGCRRVANKRQWCLFFAVLAGNEKAAADQVGVIVALRRISGERAS